MTRGRKPKPPVLRLVAGTHRPGRHGNAAAVQEAAEEAAKTFGPLKLPAHLQGEAKKAWQRWIAPAGWLDGSKEAAAIAFCELWREFRSSPDKFPASKHAAMRAYLAELGLTDERNRGDWGKRGEKDEFFD